MNKSRTELAALARTLAYDMQADKIGPILADAVSDALNRLAAALESPTPPERVQGWQDMAYAKLGAVRDKMTPEHVDAVQRFLRDEYAPQQAGGVPAGFVLVRSPITEEMHVAAVKVLHRATGVDGLPQRMLDAMLAAAPSPSAVQPCNHEYIAAPGKAVCRLCGMEPSAVQPLSEAQPEPMSEWRAEKMAREWVADQTTEAKDLIRQVENFHGIVAKESST